MIYKNQSVRIELDTLIDITTATGLEIHYKKPNGVTGFWSATRVGTAVVAITDNDDLDVVGVWRVQAKVTIDGKNKYGRAVNLRVNEL